MDLRNVDVNEVLRHLGSMADVEAMLNAERPEGCIAGQAVASAVQDLYFGGRGGVYNDIDVFTAVRRYDLPPSTKRLLTVVQSDGVSLEDAYQGLTFSARIRYQVLSSEEDGMLNRVKVHSYRLNSRRETSADTSSEAHEQFSGDILRSFDFNCVQVGIDVKNRKLIWTPEFEAFLRTRQIEVCRHHTPGHTAVRLIHKLNALPDVYADVERLMTELAGAQLAQLTRERRYAPNRMALAHPLADAFIAEGFVETSRLSHLSCQRLFGQKYKAKAEAVEDQLQPWFRLEFAGQSQQLFTLSPRVSPDEAFMRIALERPQDQYSDLADAFLKPHKPAVKERYKLLLGVPAKGSKKLLPAWPTPNFVPLKSLLTSTVPNSTLAKVSKVVAAHPELLRVAEFGRSLKHQCQLIEQVVAEAKARGEWVFGYMRDFAFDWNAAQANDSAFQPFLREKLDREEVALNEELVEPLLGTFKIDGVLVRELTSRKALMTEGSQMRHCVGGYSHAVRELRCRIFSLRADAEDKGSWSTVEVGAENAVTRGQAVVSAVRVYQHKARFNGEPTALNQAVVAKLLRLVQQRIAAKRYPVLGRIDGSGRLALKADAYQTALSAAKRRLDAELVKRGLRKRKQPRPVQEILDDPGMIPF